MAYQGTTSASSVSNPPLQIVMGISQGGFTTAPSTTINMGSTLTTTSGAFPGNHHGNSLWTYLSTDPSSAVAAAGYFTDGKTLGMRPGDIVFFGYQSSMGSSVTLSIGMIGDVTSTGASIGVGGSTGSWLSSTR